MKIQKFIKQNLTLIIILLVGIIFRILLTSNGNFIFHMDSARDMVDVREMVELKKLRLTGPTSAIQGVYDGPAWYYLLAIPYILSHGDPYSEIIMEVFLWAVGGFFLMKLLGRFGKLSQISGGILWCFSNYIVLLTMYAFNPNPVTLLSPLFIYLLVRFLETNELLFYLGTWGLAGLFFNFEMNAGIFPPFIILISQIIRFKKGIFSKTTILGILVFIATLLPQALFDLKHQLLMTKSLLSFIHSDSGGTDYFYKTSNLWQTFYNAFNATFFNFPILTSLILVLAIYLIITQYKNIKGNFLVYTILLTLLIPFVGYIILPVTVNSWHLGIEVVAVIFLSSIILKYLPKPLPLTLTLVILFWGVHNVYQFFKNDFGKRSLDPSMYINETSAIDYVYRIANGKNFKVYVHIPSVYDYPYQYLFWWYGKKTYGYTPFDYSYLPNKPEYIPSQSFFRQTANNNLSNLVFLIKETQNPKLLDLWENNFKDYPFIQEEQVGPISIETRLDLNNLGFLEKAADKN